VAGNAHRDRARAESFGDDAEAYDRARPSYPEHLVDDLMAGHPVDVLDVGCGTGIVSRMFTPHACRVLGVDADPRMAEVASRHGVGVDVARFEDWDPAGRAFDLLVSGQAWHWVEPVGGAAVAARALRGGARFAAFWNEHVHTPESLAIMRPVYEHEAPELVEFSTVLGTIRGNLPQDPLADPVMVSLLATGQFIAPERRTYQWEKAYHVDEWIRYARTASDHHRLEPERLDRLMSALSKALLARSEVFTVGYETRLLTAVRERSPTTSVAVPGQD
jgi:SAM-dependent methyltransferase